MQPLPFPILVGMPQLAHGGLSENWLLKECGHLHWMLLAERLGLPTPDFRDGSGNRLYAAFAAVRVDGHGLRKVREHQQIRIRSRIDRVSRIRHCSHHLLECDGAALAQVEMLSAFVRRTIEGSNRAVVRCPPAERHPACADENPIVTSALLHTARMLRGDAAWRYRGFRGQERGSSANFRFTPCPRNDFNGADFLYFANFQAILDRAEWEWWRDPQTKVVERELYFHGNIDPGESVTVILRARREGEAPEHWCQIVRDSDGHVIADALTVSGPPRVHVEHRGRPPGVAVIEGLDR